MLECARVLEQYNPKSVWIPETWGAENFAMLSAASQIFTRAHMGSSIINIYSRSPSLVAMGAATLDVISSGRLILGLGSSTPKITCDLHGIKFHRPLTRMKEYIDIIRMATSGNRINYDGQIFKLRGFRLLVRPYRPQIPIYLAAVNDMMLDLAWSHADGVVLYLRPPSEIRERIMPMQRRRRIKVCCQIITAVSHDSDAARSRAKKTLAFYVSVGAIYRRFLAENGFGWETKNILQEYERAGLVAASAAVSDRMLDILTICGTPEECIKRARTFAESGIDVPILQFNPVGDPVKSMELAAKTFGEAK